MCFLGCHGKHLWTLRTLRHANSPAKTRCAGAKCNTSIPGGISGRQSGLSQRLQDRPNESMQLSEFENLTGILCSHFMPNCRFGAAMEVSIIAGVDPKIGLCASCRAKTWRFIRHNQRTVIGKDERRSWPDRPAMGTRRAGAQKRGLHRWFPREDKLA